MSTYTANLIANNFHPSKSEIIASFIVFDFFIVFVLYAIVMYWVLKNE